MITDTPAGCGADDWRATGGRARPTQKIQACNAADAGCRKQCSDRGWPAHLWGSRFDARNSTSGDQPVAVWSVLAVASAASGPGGDVCWPTRARVIRYHAQHGSTQSSELRPHCPRQLCLESRALDLASFDLELHYFSRVFLCCALPLLSTHLPSCSPPPPASTLPWPPSSPCASARSLLCYPCAFAARECAHRPRLREPLPLRRRAS